MPRTTFALPLIACLALAAGSAHAQFIASQPTAFLYVGADANQQNKLPGAAVVSAFGTVASGQFAFINADPTTTDYEGLSAFGTGQITVTGGAFQQLLADDSSVINLIGSNLTMGSDLQFDSINQPYYLVSGTLQQEQTPFAAEWIVPAGGTLEFNGLPAVPGAAPVPEASTVVSFGLLLFGAAWLAFKRRKVAA